MALENVLTAAISIACSHPSPLGGTITIKPTRRLTVAGEGVLTKEAAAVATIACSFMPPPTTNKACTKVTVSGGYASRLRVDGSPVLLARSFTAQTDGNPIAAVPLPIVPPPVPPPVQPPVPITLSKPQSLLRTE